MLNFTTRRTFLVPSFNLDAKEREKLDRFLRVLERSKIEELFPVMKVSKKKKKSVNEKAKDYKYKERKK